MPMGGTPVTLVPDGTTGATSAGIVTVGQLPAAAAGADAAANPTSSQVFSANELFNGTTWDRQRAAVGTTGVAAVNTEGTKATYRAVTGTVVMTANGVMLVLKGSATKTVRITRLVFSGTLTTAATIIAEIFRTTGDVTTPAGTATPTVVKLDSTSATGTALANSYTTAVIGAGSAGVALAACLGGSATVAGSSCVFDFGTRNSQGLVLRGVAEFMQLFINTSSYTGASFIADIEWTEE